MKKIILLISVICLTVFSIGQQKITTGNVYFRKTPGKSDNKICLIATGTVVDIVLDTVEHTNWTMINYNRQTGYIYSSYLRNYNPKSQKSGTSTNPDIKYYRNSQVQEIQSPTYYNSPPNRATAECYDGTYSFSANHRGTCSHHGGVKRWLR